MLFECNRQGSTPDAKSSFTALELAALAAGQIVTPDIARFLEYDDSLPRDGELDYQKHSKNRSCFGLLLGR